MSVVDSKEILISKYIDDELSLDEKVDFVEYVKKDDLFYKETKDMLKEEKLLAFEVCYDDEKFNKNYFNKRLKTRDLSKYYVAVAALVLIVLSFVLGFYNGNRVTNRNTVVTKKEIVYRFVYYNPSARNVALIGSFNGWKKIYLQNVGNGYWQACVRLFSDGIYKYNFVVNGKKVIYDPSNPAKIYNGFGSFDSVIKI